MRRMSLRCRQAVPAVPVVVAILAVAGGCSQPPGEIFPPPREGPRWPGPPEPTRIRYVGQLVTDADLKAGKSAAQAFREALFGKESARSMLTPFAVCTDGGDRLFVADSNAQRVHRFDLQARRYERWPPGDEQPRLSQPVGIACDPAGRLLVSDSVAGVLFAFDANGKFLGRLGEGLLQRPCGITVHPKDRRIFVADAGAHQVVVLSPEGGLVGRLGRRGEELGQFNYPTHVAIDSVGRLYVSDTLNFRVQQFDADLRPIRQIGRQGDMPGYFARPRGLAIDRQNHLYVIDANFEAVQIFDDQGVLLLSFGDEGHDPGQFWLPTGIFIDPKDRVWIADSYNRRVQVFDYLPEGTEP